MGAYNGAETVGPALESVLGQSLQDFEIIVVDDSSEDDTAKVVEAYVGRDLRVRMVRTATRSRGGDSEWDCRNDGIDRARGRYVAYLDADNQWRADYLSELSAVLDADASVQLVHCDSCNHYPAGWARDVVSRDLRTLVDSGPNWTVFSYETFDPSQLGREIYVDTNEMMHLMSVFDILVERWRPQHPRRAQVNALQVPRRPYRRHSDLDLVERVVDEFGEEGIHHVRSVLVDFFYDDADRAATPPP